MNGLKKLSEILIYGSYNYKKTLDMWTKKEDHRYYKPDILIKETKEINFGRHKLKMIYFPGHSICTMIIIINDKYLYIADELMFSNDGKSLLPSVEFEGLKRHINSLKSLKKYIKYDFIPGHGIVLKEKEEKENHIENRVKYLTKVYKTKGKISYKKAIKDCNISFLHKEWHKELNK